MANTYLDVPFKEKDEAKSLGARWDAIAVKWYVPEGTDLAPFAPWLPTGNKSAPKSSSTTDVISTLEGPASGVGLTKKAVTLSQLLTGVAQTIAQAFRAGVWTIVEVVEVRTKNGHVYLELSERTQDGYVLATARSIIWASTADKILPEFARATGATIAPGIKLLARAKPVFKPQYGFSIEIDAIDPDYTLGDLEARKREIRNHLKEEGILDANKKLPAPWDFNLVLVLAPQGAAGLGDFQAEATRLERHGICRFVYAHSRFQGQGAPKEIYMTLVDALEKLDVTTGLPDAVALIRGGGAVNDLAWLNDYDLAKTLCTLEVPVLTGIGHERDSTILDEVAHTRFDTPSKVIAGIEKVISKRVAEAKANFPAIIGWSSEALNITKGQVERDFSSIHAGAIRQISVANGITAELMNEFRMGATNTVHGAKQEVQTLMTSVRHEAHQLLFMAKQEAPAAFAELRSGAARAVEMAKALSASKMEAIEDRAALDIQRSREMVQGEMRESGVSARRMIVDARKTSTALFREVAGQGPEKTLGRGFAIVRSRDGKPVTSASQVEHRKELEIEFRDGRVITQVK